jgi:hypothetical protein
MSGFNFDISGKRKTKKQKKRAQLAQNQETGLQKQRIDEIKYKMAGYEVKRVRTGYDFDATRTNPFTGRKEHLKVESKSSTTAPMRKLQKKTQKKHKRNYKVERGNGLIT